VVEEEPARNEDCERAPKLRVEEPESKEYRFRSGGFHCGRREIVGVSSDSLRDKLPLPSFDSFWKVLGNPLIE
jgi:hypothetical protein